MSELSATTTGAATAGLAPDFLRGGGEMGERMRSHDWLSTNLGSPDNWPQPLRTVIRFLLNSGHPMYVWWGPELLCFYNDAYRRLIGPERHPGSLGQPARAVWEEIWGIIGPQIEQVLSGGGATWNQNTLVPITRNGQRDEVYWTYSYIPIDDAAEPNGIGGILVQCSETTAATERIAHQEERLARAQRARDRLFELSHDLIAVAAFDGFLKSINPAWARQLNRSEDELLARPFSEIIHPDDLEVAGRVVEALQSGEPVHQFHVRLLRSDGVAVPFAWSAVPEAPAGSGTFYTVGRDISDEPSELRQNEARLRFLDHLNKDLADLEGADEILSVTTRLLGQHLGASNCAYADMDADEDGFAIRGDWAAPGSRSIVGRYKLADFGTLAVAKLGTGQPFIVNDNRVELSPAEAAAFQSIGIAATVCMPLVKDGRLTALLAVHAATPRVWAEDELALVREVSERSWAHIERVGVGAALRSSNARFQAAVSAVQGVVWTNDADGRMTGDQPGWATLTGQSQEEYQGYGWAAVVHPDDAGPTVLAWEDAVRYRKPFIFEHKLRCHDGSWRTFAIRAVPTLAADGSITEWVGVHTDVTAQRTAEAELRDLNTTLESRVAAALAERRLLADLVEGTDAFVQVVDLDFRWMAINRACADEFERIYGVRPKTGVSMLDLLDDQPEHREEVRAIWARALAGEQFTETAEFGDPGRDRRAYEIKFNVLHDAFGERIGAYQFVYDVTSRVQEQRRLAAAETQLRQVQKMEAMGQLTGGVAHDFNNLLTPILGALDIIERKGIGDERLQRLISGAIQSAERAQVLVQRLLAFARRQPLQPVSVDIRQLISGMADLVASTLGPQIRVLVEIEEGLPPATADPNQVEMALLNLAVNARDAMEGQGTLRLAAVAASVEPGKREGLRPGRYIRVSVADSGAGMDHATLARATEPFFSTKGVGRGTGLGLSMAHGLAEQLGGGLTIQSQVGIGTNVELWLPQSDAAVSAPTTEQPLPSAKGPQGLVLLVDDEEPVRAVTADMLLEMGWVVEQASSAEAALQVINAGLRPDLVITDHLMPGMTGVELADLLRSELPNTPILLISGYAEHPGVSPVIPLLTKPFRNSDLARSISLVTTGRPVGVS